MFPIAMEGCSMISISWANVSGSSHSLFSPHKCCYGQQNCLLPNLAKMSHLIHIWKTWHTKTWTWKRYFAMDVSISSLFHAHEEFYPFYMLCAMPPPHSYAPPPILCYYFWYSQLWIGLGKGEGIMYYLFFFFFELHSKLFIDQIIHMYIKTTIIM